MNETPEWDDFYTEVQEPDSDEPKRFENLAELLGWVETARWLKEIIEADTPERVPEPESFVWSIVDPNEDEAQLYALPGIHHVNVLYYILSTEPVRPEHQDTEFIY